ncbi:MAG: hypothetical protein K1X28_05435 [Parachlamydiales bacterium]|nr:hypothetical protein [Parachlamydiales bacterium]
MSLAAKLVIFPFVLFASLIENFEDLVDEPEKIIIAKKQIFFEEFPDAFNPSMVKIDNGYIMSFRFSPDRYSNGWLSYIGIVRLNEQFDPIGSPQILATRAKNSKTQSQSEDARLFTYRGRIFLTYNDNTEINYTTYSDRRDIFIAELKTANGQFNLGPPIKLLYENKRHVLWQKNWVPFEYEGKLLMGYTVNPHEIIYVNLIHGTCYHCYESSAPIDWEFGTLRGSTPPLLVDGEYLAFFHSGIVTSSYASWGWDIWHYFMGAYTFSAKPPFALTRISSIPIITEDFYTQSAREKRVIFPGGFFAAGDHIYVCYGKDDYEIWVATIDKKALFKSLKRIER